MYHFLVETTECISHKIKPGILFYKEKKKGFEVYKKIKKGEKYVGYCSNFGELIDMANNELPHTNSIYLHP